MTEKEVNQLIANNEISAKKAQHDELTYMGHQLTTMKVDIERKVVALDMNMFISACACSCVWLLSFQFSSKYIIININPRTLI